MIFLLHTTAANALVMGHWRQVHIPKGEGFVGFSAKIFSSLQPLFFLLFMKI